MFCFTFVSNHNTDFLMLYSVQLENMYSYLNSSLKLSDIVRGPSLSYKFFTFSIFIMFSLIPFDANDPQGLMRR